MRKIFLIHFFITSLIFPQINIPSDVKEVLDKTENILKGKKIEAKINFSTNMQGMKVEFDSKLICDLSSGKFYMENGNYQILVYDGNYLWSYDKTTNFYIKMPLKNIETLPSQYVFPIFIIDISKLIPKVESINIEKIILEDKNCYLITYKGKDIKENSHTINLWINQENYYPVQLRLSTQNFISKEIFEMNYKIKSLVINPEIPDNIFIFKAPEEAKEFKFPNK